MPQLLELVVELATAFDRLQLRYAVGGALASSYWGIVRTTQDVDCLVSIPAVKYQLLADALNDLGCVQLDEGERSTEVSVVRMRSQAQTEHLIECCRGSVRIELFVPAVPLQEQILQRAVMMPIADRQVPVTSAEDLVLIKMAFHRVKDLQDVRGILWVQRGQLDLDYLRLWSSRSLETSVQSELEQLIADSHATRVG